MQDGFDDGFANVGAPLGTDLGLLRGMAAALVSYLSTLAAHDPSKLDEARQISKGLSEIRFSDIAPRDLEAEQHALEHLGSDDDDAVDESEELAAQRKMERLEDELAKLTAGSSAGAKRPTVDDAKRLKERLTTLCNDLGFNMS